MSIKSRSWNPNSRISAIYVESKRIL
ncbi:unnamed protein product [Debaryomyces tyrocola]|nr:unnamed protein product [Debaryomyces tyrocola]